MAQMSESSNWFTIFDSPFTWEREALEFVRSRFPREEPYRAWTNFEFIAEDGSVNEVDLLVFSRQGLFLVEIKSRPGLISGDAGTWFWHNDGTTRAYDNPLLAANSKAKKLKSLLSRQKAMKQFELPYVEALVFLSAEGIQLNLQANARARICLRDREATPDRPARPGIMAAIKRRECPGLPSTARGTHDKPMGAALEKALEQAGIRPSQKHRTVGDYKLERVLRDGAGYQDWLATHKSLSDHKRLVRIYQVPPGASADERNQIQRAAKREFLLLESLRHDGIPQAYQFTEHTLGPALILEFEENAVRLDHFIAENHRKLNIEQRLNLIQQVAEIVQFAHRKTAIHRGLSAQSVVIADPQLSAPRVQVWDWQLGYRDPGSEASITHRVSMTNHVEHLIEDARTGFMAPEAVVGDNQGEHVDVFSLGTIAYFVLTGTPPAANSVELSERLRDTQGLDLSAQVDGVIPELQDLVRAASHPVVSQRTKTVADFLAGLELVYESLTEPQAETVEDPAQAKPGDLLPEGFRVINRLGQGGTAVGLLVQRGDEKFVMKIAREHEHNTRLREEAEVLNALDHPNIIRLRETVELGDKLALLFTPVLSAKERADTRTGAIVTEDKVETLAHRLRAEGRFQAELLERFGRDLLKVLQYLEESGRYHRDIKPDNIAVGRVGRGDPLHLVVFDFSLSKAPTDNIRAGTPEYLDPLLPRRKPPRWDLHAERYAAAVTLYEMATGTRPRWGDGRTEPSQLPETIEISIESELFDSGLREGLTTFFKKAFKRDLKQRFDNAESMLAAWDQLFQQTETQPGEEQLVAAELAANVAKATLKTQVPELGLSTRATNTLDRANILTVSDLLKANVYQLNRLRGVGKKTRNEITDVLGKLRAKFGQVETETETTPTTDNAAPAQSIDAVAGEVTRRLAREADSAYEVRQHLLGMKEKQPLAWPSQTDIAKAVGLSRQRILQMLQKQRERWAKHAAITSLRNDMALLLARDGGVMTHVEMAEAVLAARGSIQENPKRQILATAALRACAEAEATLKAARFIVRRHGDRVLFVSQDETNLELTDRLGDYAIKLGEKADEIAQQDPLLTPARALETLRNLPAPQGATALSDSRLLRLAVAMSGNAALSVRQEIYPRGMAAIRALRLSQGALFGADHLSVGHIHERVRSRYAHAEPLPARPALDDMLAEVGLQFEWEIDEKGGSYRNKSTESLSRTQSATRLATGGVVSLLQSPEEFGDARLLEEKLQRAHKEGAFLVLSADDGNYPKALDELLRRFDLEHINLDHHLLRNMREICTEQEVDWKVVLRADTRQSESDWNNLLHLFKLALDRLEKSLPKAKTLLFTFPGLLRRYDQMTFFERLRERVSTRGGLHGAWLLVPGGQPRIDDRAVPIISPAQHAHVPLSWLRNVHRAAQGVA